MPIRPGHAPVMGGFRKYRERGGYHWNHLSKSPWRHHCYTATRYALVLEAARIQPGERVLDLGCGDGALTYLMARAGGSCTGVEPDDVGRSIAETEFARRGLSARFVGHSLELGDESYDIVVCSEVIEHLGDPDALLREAFRVLKPGGRIILTTPVRLTESPQAPEHVREFFPSELVSVVERYFRVEEHRLEMPIFLLELYYWRPAFLLKLPLTRICMNILSGWFGVRVLAPRSRGWRYYALQLVVGRKPT